MAKQIQTSIDIQASPAKVWEVFTDFESYPAWNPFVKWLKGEVKVGQPIEVQLPGMKFTPTVLAFSPNQELRWLGHLGIKGLFDGEHVFQFEALPNGNTRLHHFETFRGVLAGILLKWIGKDTKNGFESFNEALKNRVEEIEWYTPRFTESTS